MRSRTLHSSLASRATGPSVALLTHPAWWAALALLLLNDHLLKGSGALPSWLTGKVSDFAGLVVAPILLVVLVGARSARARALCFTAVAVAFAAIKLSPWCARAVEDAMSVVGLRWRIWVDPTDLVAFAVLPFAWRMVARRTEGNLPTLATHAIARTGLVLGVFACSATSQLAVPMWQSESFLVNRTGSTQLVGVRRLLVGVKLDCASVEADPGRLLADSLFGAVTTYRLDDDSTVPLDAAAGVLTDSRPDPASATIPPNDRPECAAAWVSADGIDPTVVFWRRDTPEPVLLDGYPSSPASTRAVALAGSPSARTLRPDGPSVVAALQAPPETGSCRDTGPESPFTWGELPDDYANAELHVVGVSDSERGCVVVSIDKALTPGHPIPWTLCVPREAIPFRAGERLSLSLSDDFAQLTGSAGVLSIGRGESTVAWLDVPSRLEPMDCTPTRPPCGAYSIPADVVLTPDGQSPIRIPPGGHVTLDGEPYAGTQVFIGHARSTSVVGSTCNAPLDQIGAHVDYAILYR